MAAKAAPILVAAFDCEEKLWASVSGLKEKGIGPEFIGVYIGGNGVIPGHHGDMYLVSAFAASRLHDDIRSVFASCGASEFGGPQEMRASHGTVPHPGSIEDRDLKLPLGMEYPDTVRRRTPANGNGSGART